MTPPSDPRWAQFEEIGLRPKSTTAKRAAKLVVSSYRLLGFGILTLVVAVLVGYIATSVFYLVNRTWIVPVVLSPSDEKVVAQKAELATQRNERERIAAAVRDADRAIVEHRTFQDAFAKAIKSDLAGRQAALGQLRALARKAARTRDQIYVASGAYASSHAAQMTSEYAAGLIDRQSMVAGKYQLAQIATSKLSVAERQHQFDAQADELATQTRSLDALLSDRGAEVALSYDVLKIKRDLDQSRLELARAIENRDALKASLARQDETIAELSGSVYLRAVHDQATVAMVPYSNLGGLQPGAALYACWLEMLWCRHVGDVLAVLPGEIQLRHPHRDKAMRGQMIELRMIDASATHDDVLFVGKPLGL